MSAVDVDAAKEAVIAEAMKMTEAHDAKVAILKQLGTDGTVYSDPAPFMAAVRTLRAALAPPPPERRRWIVETEDRRVRAGEDGSFLFDPTPSPPMCMSENLGLVVSVEPVGVNTVTLEPGQYVVEVRAPVGLNERWFMQTGRNGENCDVIRGVGIRKHPVVVREFVAPTPETGAP